MDLFPDGHVGQGLAWTSKSWLKTLRKSQAGSCVVTLSEDGIRLPPCPADKTLIPEVLVDADSFLRYARNNKSNHFVLLRWVLLRSLFTTCAFSTSVLIQTDSLALIQGFFGCFNKNSICQKCQNSI